MEHFVFNKILCGSIIFLKLSLAAVDTHTHTHAHTLVPNHHVTIGKTLISQNQVFEMGFFKPGKSVNRFLGIWYKSTPHVVVWVANRNDPITVSAPQGLVFSISENGSLLISSGKSSIIWSENHPSGVASNPVLHLLDTGNLVVVNGTRDNDYLWQSFDHPTDTLLPGMKMVDDADAGVERYLTSWRNPDDPSPGDFVFKLENNGLASMVVLKGTMKRYRLGQWNGMIFCGVQSFPDDLYNPQFVFRQERLISIGDIYESSFLVRTTLDTSGSLLRNTMNARRDKWNLATTFPLEMCDEYDSCGPNCICKSDRPIRCQCFRGFEPKIPKDWDYQDWSDGCTRTQPLNCHGGDGFLEVRGVKYPDMSTYLLNTTMSLGECKAECSRNCNCTAYANPFITDGGRGCLMWFGDLLDTKQLSGAHSKQNIYIRVPVSELDVSTDLQKAKENKRPIKLMLISVAFGVLVSTFINRGLLYMARRKRQEMKRNDEDVELPVIKMATIVRATNNFSTENMIGVGGFGHA